MLDAQQQQLSGMQEQLLQLKDMHKKKLTRYKAQLQQQYESQLAAATTAYTQELSMVHVSLVLSASCLLCPGWLCGTSCASYAQLWKSRRIRCWTVLRACLKAACAACCAYARCCKQLWK
jgi:hypothetical protein